jgi:hypothetical protein
VSFAMGMSPLSSARSPPGEVADHATASRTRRMPAATSQDVPAPRTHRNARRDPGEIERGCPNRRTSRSTPYGRKFLPELLSPAAAAERNPGGDQRSLRD